MYEIFTGSWRILGIVRRKGIFRSIKEIEEHSLPLLQTGYSTMQNRRHAFPNFGQKTSRGSIL